MLVTFKERKKTKEGNKIQIKNGKPKERKKERKKERVQLITEQRIEW